MVVYNYIKNIYLKVYFKKRKETFKILINISLNQAYNNNLCKAKKGILLTKYKRHRKF